MTETFRQTDRDRGDRKRRRQRQRTQEIQDRDREDQTHKMFKRTLFIRTKHKLRIFVLIPFIKLQNDT